ncbi:MAG: hypothetical protein HY763_06215 [Planctomycetes bacterium]|nr:hypothetical protein [Planctomycetota bacterium]
MPRVLWQTLPVGISAMLSASCLCGCASAPQRNTRESIVISAPREPTMEQVSCVLELRNGREELALTQTAAFLASERGAKLARRIQSELRRREHAVRETIAQARAELGGGVAVLRPDSKRPYADGNLVVYLAGKTNTRLLFSREEMAQLLAFHQVGDDLTTIHYTHPEFTSERLAALCNRLADLGLSVKNATLSAADLERMKTEAAARILERHLRRGGANLSERLPLVTYGLLSPPTCPKLSAALKDAAAVDRLVRSNDPDCTRALLRLVRLRAVELACP